MPPIPAHVGDRRMDRAKIRRVFTTGPEALSATDAEIDAALATVNQDAIYDAERSTWTTQVWDRKSPINGVPAQYFLDRVDVDEKGTDDIYLLLRDGQVVMFQPHEPDVQGLVRVPRGRGLARGNTHADVISADNASGEVVRRVREHIIANRPK